MSKPRLLIISAVHPFPRSSGQQQRVYYKLKALVECFQVFFLTFASEDKWEQVEAEVEPLCDRLILLPSLYGSSTWTSLIQKIRGVFFQLRTGLKFSNFVIGEIEFSPERLQGLLGEYDFDLALFEYWHAHRAVPFFQTAGVPCVLDMHNVMWQSFSRQLDARPFLPKRLREWMVSRYRQFEEAAWRQYDALIAINQGEYDYAKEAVSNRAELFYAPMGIDLESWPYSWDPALPPGIGYYGGLGSAHNQESALLCYREIMPRIWTEHPEAVFWIVGSNPPAGIMELESDPRVRVTGFVPNVGGTLKNLQLVLCPWAGTYGFRSRVIEVMALGVPVVASPSAVYGMDLGPDQGLSLAETSKEMAALGLRLLADPAMAQQLSLKGRKGVEEQYSYQATYEKLAGELLDFAADRR